jgi:tRNA(fMet)-specific endonuclease VapC
VSWLLDTDVVIAAIDRRPSPTREAFDRAGRAGETTAISSLTVHELWHGVERSARRESDAAALAEFLSGPIPVVELDADDAREAAGIRAELARRGAPAGPYDLLIAAQARRRGLTLVTAGSRDFARIPGLAWEDWARAPARRR